MDTTVHRWAVTHRSAALTAAARTVTASGTGVGAYLLAAAAAAVAGGRRRWWAGSLLAAVAVGLSQAVRLGVSVAIGRSRPPQADWASSAGGYAFPSGHTTTATVVAVLGCAALAAGAPRAGWLPLAQWLFLGWAVLVGFTRMYLGVHWPTDVLGGWLYGSALILGGYALVGPSLRRRRAAVATPR